MKIVILLIIYISLNADIKDTMFNYYQNKKFEKVCNIGHRVLDKNAKDEEFVSLYAFGCLKSDYIDRLTIPISLLKFTKESRSNSAYFSVILMQKKLLYHALVDKYELYKLELPSTDYVLSKVFDLYSKLGNHERRNVYFFEDKQNKKINYKLYLEKDGNLSKMVIEEFYDTMAVHRHVYW